ncbi:hypothetical protein ADUPG1_013114 [Aduncisulcus paluster]|uniref:Uncharacterized protein n=1 Tax=Aduncisulcus paluster TaxID=2918883 RepID=A0ABQ5K1T0_9EUKA|nr:hypothetical protein ADUPG1_013114 [Aduncisulcus paluster]
MVSLFGSSFMDHQVDIVGWDRNSSAIWEKDWRFSNSRNISPYFYIRTLSPFVLTRLTRPIFPFWKGFGSLMTSPRNSSASVVLIETLIVILGAAEHSVTLAFFFSAPESSEYSLSSTLPRRWILNQSSYPSVFFMKR